MNGMWEWAKRRFRKPETQMRQAIQTTDTAERVSSVIFLGALVASWWTQYSALLVTAGVVLAVIVPFAIDMLAYAAAKLLQLSLAPWWLRMIAGLVLLVAMSGSILYNTMMSVPWSTQWWEHATPVGLYLLSEVLAGGARWLAAKLREEDARRTRTQTSRTKNDELRARIAELEAEISAAKAAPATPAKRPSKPKPPLTLREMESPGYPAAPVSGGPAGPRGRYGPRDPEKGYSKRTLSRIAAKRRSEGEVS